MRALLSTLVIATAVGAFQSPPPSANSALSTTALYEYIPSGFTKKQWAAFKAKEKKEKDAKNLGRLGPRGFQSRSMQSFQEALERGEADHLMPMFNAKEKLKRGEIKQTDIPYMQRGGAWDNSDVRGAKKKNWLASDKTYDPKKYTTASILGEGPGLDWTGKRDRQGPKGPVSGVKLSKNYKPPNINTMGGASNETPKKKRFGFF